MHIKLYNTESRAKEEIVPLEDKLLRMYTCGPTVYNFAHIGNFRTYVFEDLLRRTLKFFGFKVIQVMNLTDIDDKTIKGASENGVSLEDYTRPFIEAFFEDIKTLNIEPVEFYPAATDYVPQMIEMIEKLMKEGVAYKGADESIYFSISHFPSYGRLSHLHLHELKSGASERVATDEYDKENVSDFVLWKAYDPNRDAGIFWESPFGPGRPGWHIECSAMAISLLGDMIDIHCGGVDNMFPHHENEIAQSECYSCKRFVKYWLHAEHLLVDHKKMSKSLGNFYTLRDLLTKGYTGPEVRYLLLQTHYRTQLNFSMAGLDAARHSLTRLNDFIYRLRAVTDSTIHDMAQVVQKTRKLFMEALADDLNISVALSALFEMVREVNILIDSGQIGSKGAGEILSFLNELDKVLGVLTLKEDEVPKELQEALHKRDKARHEKNWAESDKWRDFILSKGYLIEDTPKGARLKKHKG